MKNYLILLMGIGLSISSFAGEQKMTGILAYDTKEQAVERLTRGVPINGTFYTCPQLVYSYSVADSAIKLCNNAKHTSASSTGNTMCFSWAMLKGNGDLGLLNQAMRKGEADFKNGYSTSQHKDVTCNSIKRVAKDFLE